MPKGNGATSRAFPPTPGSFSTRWRSRTSISSKGCRRRSRSSSAAPARNPRSTIATTTEIYDYLRVLFSAVGQPHDPVTGQPIHRQTPQQIVDQILAYRADSKIILLAPIVQNEAGEFRDVIEKLKREGFVRVRIDGEIMELGQPEPIRLKKTGRHTIEAVVDRLVDARRHAHAAGGFGGDRAEVGRQPACRPAPGAGMPPPSNGSRRATRPTTATPTPTSR